MLGHELTHIRNGDVRMMVIAVIIAGVISFFAELVFRLWFYSGFSFRSRSDDRGGGRAAPAFAILIAVALIAVAWVLSFVIRLALSRSREFLADAGSVELTKNPDAMISALRKIEGRGELPGATSAVMEMCVDNPREGFGELFDTHPTVDSRVAALVKFAGGHDPGPLALPPHAGATEPQDDDQRRPGRSAADAGPWGDRAAGTATAAAATDSRSSEPAAGRTRRPAIAATLAIGPSQSGHSEPDRFESSRYAARSPPQLRASGGFQTAAGGCVELPHVDGIAAGTCSRFGRGLPVRICEPDGRRVNGERGQRGIRTMAKPTVVVVGADKGGVGKTTVARTLLDYFTAHQVPTRAFDTESPKGTLKRFHPDITEIVDVTSVPDQMRIFDTLSTTDASVTVIDVRAGLLSPTLRALRDIGFLDAAKKGQLTFVVFHILGSSIASLNEIEDTAPSPPTPNISWSRTSSTTPASSNGTRPTHTSYFKKLKDAVEITIPKLNEMAYEQVELASVPFLTFVANKRPEGRGRQLFVRAARLCPALARQRLGRIRPHQAQRHRRQRRAGARAGGGPRVQVVR